MINQIIAQKFIIKKLIGEGAFGKVYQGNSKKQFQKREANMQLKWYIN